MALVSQGFALHVTVVDTNGDTSVLSFNMRKNVYADVLTDAATIITRLLAVTTGNIKAYTVAQRFAENALTFPANSHVERRAVVVARVAGSDPSKTATIVIPSPEPTIFMGTEGEASKIVDTGDTALNDYLAIWKATDGLATLSDGETLLDTSPALRGRLTHRQSSYG